METVFFVFEIALAGLVFVFNLLGMTGAVSMAFALSFIVLLAFVCCSSALRDMNPLLLALILLSVINVLTNATINPAVSFSFDYFKKLIFFCTSIIFFQLSLQINVTEKTVLLIRIIVLAMTAFLAADYFIIGNRTMLGRYLTLGFSNPNFTAMWMLHLGIFFVYFFATSKSFAMKALYAAAFAFIIFIITKTENRSSLLVIVFFFAMLLTGIVRRKYSLNKVVLGMIILLPFIFVMLYQGIIANTKVTQLFGFAASVGKGLNSRIQIWNYAADLLRNNGWVIGDYASIHINNETGMLQMHNSHLDTLVSYGVIPFLLFLGLHYHYLTTVNQKIRSMSQYAAFCGFLSVIILGTFEAGIYTGCTGLNFLSGAFLLLASVNDKAADTALTDPTQQEYEYE